MFQPHELRRFSVAEYRRIIDLGILTESDRVELIDGHMSCSLDHPPTPRFELVQGRLRSRIVPVGCVGWVALGPTAVTLSASVTRPAVAVARGSLADYDGRSPGADDVAVVVEVSDRGLEYDRAVKGWVYARDSIPSYWIVNVPEQRIEVYTGPTNEPTYHTRTDYSPGSAVPVVVGGVTVGALPIAEVFA